jgi:biopolymer transport protein ExbD
MSDIAFLLLIFFLVSTIFADEQGLPMQLPGAASEQAQINRKNLLQIEVQANNTVLVGGVPMAVSAIENEIRQRIAANPKLVIKLEAHPDSFYGTMVDVLDELQLAEASKVSIGGLNVE